MAPTLLLSLEHLEQVWLNSKIYNVLELSKIIHEGNNEINGRKKSDTNQTDNEECKYNTSIQFWKIQINLEQITYWQKTKIFLTEDWTVKFYLNIKKLDHKVIYL